MYDEVFILVCGTEVSPSAHGGEMIAYHACEPVAGIDEAVRIWLEAKANGLERMTLWAFSSAGRQQLVAVAHPTTYPAAAVKVAILLHMKSTACEEYVVARSAWEVHLCETAQAVVREEVYAPLYWFRD